MQGTFSFVLIFYDILELAAVKKRIRLSRQATSDRL